MTIKRFLPIFILFVFLIFASCDASSVYSDQGNAFPAETTSQPQPEDVILIDNERVTVTYMGVSDMPSLGVFYVILNITNHMDSEVVATLESADVDGAEIPLIMTGVPVNIRPGNSATGSFIFSMVNLSINSVTEANQATFRLVLRDAESFNTVYESDLLSVDLQ